MTSHFLFLTGNDSHSVVQRLHKLSDEEQYSELYISLIYIDELVSDAIVDVLRHKKWDGVHLAHCTGKVDVVITNALALDSVQKISLLPDGHAVNDQCLYALANGLKTNRTVTSLVLRVDLSLSLADALAEGLAHNAALSELSLLVSASDRQAISKLAQGIQRNHKLTSLKLNRCSLEDGHVSDLVRALDNHPSLIDLSVQGSSCRSKGMIAITSLLKSNSKKLVKLDLSNQQETTTIVDSCALSFLAAALPTNTSLQVLDLSSNRLRESDVTSLAAALTENSTLQVLSLVHCHITDKGAATLALHLPAMKGLRKLWLYGNPLIERSGAQALLEAVQSNVHLHELLLPKRPAALVAIEEQMEYWLMLNRGGRKILKKSSHLPAGLWPLILSATSQVQSRMYSAECVQANLIHSFLTQGPVLLER